MPHFENLEKYETTDPKSGRKEILPIAPHSLQASDYRPRKREGGPIVKKNKLPDFPEVKVEPISVEQMEKEFKMAGRQRSKAARSRKTPFWRRLSKWISGIFAKRKRADASRGIRNRPRKSPQGPSNQRGNSEQTGQGNQDGSRSGRRRRRPRTGNRGQEQGPRQGQEQGPRRGQEQGKRQGQGQGQRRNQDQGQARAEGSGQERPQGQQQDQPQGSGNQNRNRNRRNRRRPSGGGNKSGGNNQE